MTTVGALVGQFSPGCQWFRARPVDLEGQPTWLLVQMRAMWAAKFRRDTDALVAALLERDWSVLAHTRWPASTLTEQHPEVGFSFVNGVGRGHPDRLCGRALVGDIRGDVPPEDVQWAYLWEHAGGALHVYVAAHGEWHHVATVDAKLFGELTDQLAADVEARLGWLAVAA
jgi:hypothetical protein